ncbi:hypothetical protein ABB07_37855 [Streptomyces incarnatus]|uniref:Amidohydrolase-related domain-containing protein n=1 Tax=Streptomyces incarnatus TaxID=665007 RepID=A0ABN4GPI0_9ACTN|nr:hypothetical protein ABB07_37855 [Streptomyces incarnatus]
MCTPFGESSTGYGRLVPGSEVDTVALGLPDGSVLAGVGVAEGPRVGTEVGVTEFPEVMVEGPFWELLVGRGPAVRGGAVGVGEADGVGGVAEAAAGVVGPVAGGGARGTVRDGCGRCAVSGSARRAASAQDAPTPAAARSSRRRVAARRIAS